MTAFEVMEQAGWSADDWNQLDADIRAVVKATAKVRGILPVGPPAPNAYQVSVPKVDDGAELTLDTSRSVVPVRLARKLKIKSEQIGDRNVVGTLAKRAAHTLAGVEDLVLAFGGHLAAGKAKNEHAQVLLANLEHDTERLTPGLSPKGPNKGKESKEVLEAVKDAIAELQTKGHFGPYKALMLPEMWAAAAKDLGDLSISTQQALQIALGEGGELIPLPTFERGHDRCGVVISTGSGAFDFVEVAPPSLTLVSYDEGDLILRVEERIVLRVLDSSAAIDIRVHEKPGHAKHGPEKSEKPGPGPAHDSSGVGGPPR